MPLPCRSRRGAAAPEGRLRLVGARAWAPRMEVHPPGADTPGGRNAIVQGECTHQVMENVLGVLVHEVRWQDGAEGLANQEIRMGEDGKGKGQTAAR